MKSIYIDTLGCEKNTYDSEQLMALLEDEGFELTDYPEEADIMIVNTCGFIDDAKTESIQRIFELSNIKEELSDENKKLIVTGCLSQRYHEELVEEMPEVDMFFGVNEYKDIAGILKKEASEPSIALKDKISNVEDGLPYRERLLPNGAYSAVLKIAEGCNNACAFCAIPSIRGRYRSKRIEDCIREAKDMADAGIKELILIAQDTSQYGKDLYGEIRLPELLNRICEIDGIEWIRLLYVYDNGITDELIETIASQPKICKYIDIPIQHVANNVLHAMKRQSSKESIIDSIKRLMTRIPDIHIRTTVLVGFPGETEADIEELIDFIDTMKIDRLGAFAFSDEEGTASFEMDGKLSDEVKEERRNAVMAHQRAVSEELNMRKIGKVYDVIVDEVESDGVYIGRTRFDAPEIDCDVIFQSDRQHEPGDFVKVRINSAFEYDLEAEEV